MERTRRITPSPFLTGAIAVLIFLIPTNVFLKFPYPDASVFGITVDYLLPKLYMSDLTVFCILLLTWRCWSKNMVRIMCVVSMFAGLHLILHRYNPALPSILWMVLKWFELTALTLVLITQRKLLSHPWIVRAFAGTILFQTALGAFQFASQRSLLGYAFFGEPSFAQRALLVKTELPELMRILPYGTTPHPNVLAGVVVLMFFMLMRVAPRSFLTQLCGSCALIIALATQSTVALCALFFGFLCSVFANSVAWNSKTKLWLLLAFSAVIVTMIPLALQFATQYFPESTSFLRRTQLNVMGVRAFLAQSFEGVGLNAFTAVEHKYGEVVSTIRFVQPVHHVPLLFFAETGILGLLFFITFCIIAHKYYSVIFASLTIFLLPLTLIFSLDHYIYSHQQGLLMFAFILAFLFEKKGRKIRATQ